ncbi:MAG: N(4)-(beta-N-acetylglucosaminyl)-L-asparaginase [Pirellulaceae bacterium]|nr:N(4)-(beta-N-acetylglucosaminyl)-L-asparaginase [Planctomycetales bacterium]
MQRPVLLGKCQVFQVLLIAFFAVGDHRLLDRSAMGQAPATGERRGTDARPLIISTWPFGLAGNEQALKAISEGGSTLDAVERGIGFVESSGNQSVGLSGKPNGAGYAQLDSCIMHGPGHLAGSVAAIEGIVHPISAARRVMEKSPHVMMVGEGARLFAIEQGLESVAIDDHVQKLRAYQSLPMSERGKDAVLAHPALDKKGEAVPGPKDNHDTIAMLVLGADGTISGGCSTSGLSNKLPGRVGDSPIIGSGLYVDNSVGAAGATGVGENVMRYCGSFLVVEFMRQGMHPTDACRKVIERIASIDPRGEKLDINFIALDKQGRFGAAGTGDFPHSVTYPGFHEVITSPRLR